MVWTIRVPTFKSSVFEWIWTSNVRYSSPDCSYFRFQNQNSQLVLQSIYPSICSRLSDDMDDVASAASSALLPIITHLMKDQTDLKIEPGLDSI